jgi:hypothetical protein
VRHGRGKRRRWKSAAVGIILPESGILTRPGAVLHHGGWAGMLFFANFYEDQIGTGNAK